jgi:hypothetical protein
MANTTNVHVFFRALSSGPADVVQMLIDQTPGILQATMSHQETCLARAVDLPREIHLSMVKILLENGADPNGPRPVMPTATYYSYPEVIDELEKYGAGPSKLIYVHTAAWSGSIEMV